ncbi:MAG TPA: VOC family protein [Bacillus sp. (in: firmicutes)]|uniref:VOC family protein n=1 Tax=Bacillus litorisediminis TaxID=2922713 RepID=UPI001FAB8319|nr:VOC family protein [Bacillus litorisediminis]HWO75152.1 VOC family protein [Bacillus sp. (in: firmicutes)]
MTKQIWVNLPVKDINQSKEFYTKLGFTVQTHDQEQLILRDFSSVVMLFPVSTFKQFTRHEITDTNQATEVLLSIDAESREEVDSLAEKAATAGGTIFATPSEIGGWMYGCGFTDLDGHRWNVLFRDMSKMPG